MKDLSHFVVLKDSNLARRWQSQKPAMSTLCEAYLDEALDIVDLDGFFDARAELVDYSLTVEHVKQFVTRMVPEWTLHSLAQDRRLVREHYDHGDDFFAAFLGERMVYTSGIFHDESQSLEQGQDNNCLAQGNSECFQVVAHKNLDGFDRKIFLPRSAAAQRAA